MEVNKVDDRALFLQKLQLEYLTQWLRSRIYRDEKYVKIASGIAEKKRQKICMLGEKFGMETLFSPGFPVTDFVSKYFWNSRGLPNFQYKDEEQRSVQWNYDAWYILFRGTEVVFRGEMYKVVKNNPREKKVEITNGAGMFELGYGDIQLIDKYLWIR